MSKDTGHFLLFIGLVILSIAIGFEESMTTGWAFFGGGLIVQGLIGISTEEVVYYTKEDIEGE